MYLNESIQTKTLILLLCFLQTPCKYNVSFTKDSKLTGILDIIIITLVVFVLIFFLSITYDDKRFCTLFTRTTILSTCTDVPGIARVRLFNQDCTK